MGINDDTVKLLSIALGSRGLPENLLSNLGLNFTNVLFADSTSTAKNQDGSPSRPFSSLQQVILKAETLPGKTRKLILIAPDSKFDEDVEISDKWGIGSIIGLGPWTLGDGAGNAFSSTTPRNLTISGSKSIDGGSTWPGVVIGTLFDDETSSTHTAYHNGVTISGDFIVGAISNTFQLHMRNVKVAGNFDGTATTQGIQTYIRRCYFDNAFNSPSAILNIVESTQFDSLITVLLYNRMWQCEVRSGMTVTGSGTTLPPAGMFQTDFKGVFTGSVGSLKLDAVTNYFFKQNAASLAGGATKTILGDLTP